VFFSSLVFQLYIEWTVTLKNEGDINGALIQTGQVHDTSSEFQDYGPSSFTYLFFVCVQCYARIYAAVYSRCISYSRFTIGNTLSVCSDSECSTTFFIQWVACSTHTHPYTKYPACSSLSIYFQRHPFHRLHLSHTLQLLLRLELLCLLNPFLGLLKKRTVSNPQIHLFLNIFHLPPRWKLELNFNLYMRSDLKVNWFAIGVAIKAIQPLLVIMPWFVSRLTV
jgi:hypothetical protein